MQINDTNRLDFVIGAQAFIHETKTDVGGVAYQLWIQNEDEEFIAMHESSLFFSTPRAAIDSAIEWSIENANPS